jgi:RHS repeat-associated protein
MSSHRNRVRRSLQAKKAKVITRRPQLEALEERLPPGDAVSGGLLARSLLASGPPLVGFGGAFAEQLTLPVVAVAREHGLIAAADAPVPVVAVASATGPWRATVPDVPVRAQQGGDEGERVTTGSLRSEDASAAGLKDPFDVLVDFADPGSTAARPRLSSGDLAEGRRPGADSPTVPGINHLSHMQDDLPSDPGMLTSAPPRHGLVGNGSGQDNALAPNALSVTAPGVAGSGGRSSAGAMASAVVPQGSGNGSRTGPGDGGWRVQVAPVDEPPPLIPGCGSEWSPPGPGPTRATLSVPTETAAGVTTSFSLFSGVHYLLTAAGDVKVGALPTLRGDAQFQDLNINPRNMSADGTTRVGLLVSGVTISQTHPIWGNYRPTHVYTLSVIGQGQPLHIYYSDAPSTYPLHQGSLSVLLVMGSPTSDPGNCPGATSPTCDDCSCGDDGGPPTSPGPGGPRDPRLFMSQRGGAGDEAGAAAPGSCTGPTTGIDFSPGGIRYFNGTVKQSTRDLVSYGFGTKWGQTRSWTNDAGYAPNAFNGGGVIISQQPYLLNPNSTTIIVITSGINARFFLLQSGIYRPTFFIKDTLTHDTANNRFIYTDTVGNQITFWDFSLAVLPNQRGQFKGFADPFADPQYDTTNVFSWNTDGKIQEVRRRDAATGLYESYLYTYQVGPNGLLASVTLRRSPDTITWTLVREVAYTYYDGSTPGGNAGTLQSATVCTADPCGPQSASALDTSYYRWYPTDTQSPTQYGGFVGALKIVVGAQSFARLKGAVGDPIANPNMTDAQIAPYADYQYVYYAPWNTADGKKVYQATVQGVGCSSCTGGQGTFTYVYTAGSGTGWNGWAVKTTETLPDGNTNTLYTNGGGEVMMKIYENSPQENPRRRFATFYHLTNDGAIDLKANPSAVITKNQDGTDVNFDQYSDLLNQQTTGFYTYLQNSSGLIERTDYGASTTAMPTMAGDVLRYYKDSQLQQGQMSTPIALRSVTYFQRSASSGNGGGTIYPVAARTVYRNPTTLPASCTDPTNCETTNYAYTWQSNSSGDTTRPATIAVSRPIVLNSGPDQHGPGTADTETSTFDQYGRVTQFQDADGFLTNFQYDAATSAVTQIVRDPGSSPHLNLTTSMTVDKLGRTTQFTDPSGNITYNVYNDLNYEVRTYAGWQTGTNMPTGPTRVLREDRGHSSGDATYSPTYLEMLSMSTPPHLTGNLPDGTEAPAGIQSLARSYTSLGGQVYRTDAYFDIPDATYSANLYAGSAGVVNTGGSVSGNYWSTQFAYDKRGRQKRALLPTGTINRTVYDGLGRLVCNWVGTSDTDFVDDNGCNQSPAPANMIKTSALTYDFGSVGDSNLTSRIDYPSGSAVTSDQRETDTLYDWRDRPVLTKQGVQATEDTVTHRPIFYTEYDNLNEVTFSERYDGDQQYLTGWPSPNGVPNRPSANLLRAQTTPQYDNQMRVFESNVFSVDQGNGTVSANSLKTDYWFDHRGNQIKMSAPGGLVTKTTYDSVRRPLIVYTTDGQESGQTGTSWQKAQTIAGDTVLTQTENQYDNNGNVIRVRRRDRFHDGTALGALRTPNLAPKARVSYVASYYDRADRLTDQVDVGTVGGLTSGQSTGGNTATTLNDTTQMWQTNQWAGLAVEIIAGTGAGQVGTIASNTNNQLTVTSAWTTVPDATSLYAVAYVPPAAVPARSDTVLVSSYGYKADAVTRVALTATGGTFKLIYNGTPTAAISYNAAASDVQSALQPLVGTNNVLVSGPTGGVGVPGGPWLVRFVGSLAEMKVSDLTGDGSGLTGGTLSVVPQSQGGDSGRTQKTTDPRALISKTDYDAMGRTLRAIDNFVGFVPTDGSDRQTEFTYDGSSHIITRTAKLSNTSVETTQYAYGVTRDSSCNTNANSCLNSNDLLASIHYPGDPVMVKETYAYNALGQTKTKSDRNQSVHQYTFDVLGRQIKDAVTTLGAGVDNHVLALATAFDTGGRPYLFTSYNSATATDPVANQVNQVQRTFDGLSQLTAETQIHGNSQATSLTVNYAYSFVPDAGGPNKDRLTQITYPNGSIVRYEYNSGLDDTISRLSFLADDNGGMIGTHLEEYSYLGLNTVVKRAHPEPGIDLTYLAQSGDPSCAPSCNAGDQYTGLDLFGRVIDQRWIPTSSPQNPTDRFQYTYDRDSNRLMRTNAVNTLFSESYGYDSFNQLTSFSRGTHSEGWTLDNLGNWKSFTNDQTGPPTENRMHNVQNQIVSIDAGLATPTYDANGNTKSDERNNTYSFDAWNRLAQVVTASSTLTYRYDALNRRIVESVLQGMLATSRDLYYSKDWQVLEERSSGTVQARNVWSAVYVDTMVLRDSNGQRLYVQQDANWNVTAIISTAGAPQERYAYDPYGKATVYDPVAWTVRGSGQYGTSNFGWVYLHQGGRYTRFDDLSGLYYFRNRDLSPTLGRWMEEDPTGYVGGSSNLYDLEQARPTSLLDPSGLLANPPLGPPPVIIGYGVIVVGILTGELIYESVRCYQAAQESARLDQLRIDIMPPPPMPPGRPRRTGDCSFEEWAALQAMVDLACKVPRKCKSGQDLPTLQANLAKNLACAAARDTLNQKCFPNMPKDDPHQIQADNARKSAADCMTCIANLLRKALP